MTISGTDFGDVAGFVEFDDVNATITSWSATEIVITSPSVAPGSYDLKVNIPSAGCAVDDGWVYFCLYLILFLFFILLDSEKYPT